MRSQRIINWVKSLSLFMALGLMLVSTGCKDEVTGGGSQDIVFPETGPVSYQRQVQPLLNIRCAFSGCHASDTYSLRGWDLTEWGRFVYVQSIVLPNDTLSSRLIKAIKGIPPSPPMPPAGNPLNQNQIRGLVRWVAQGARQDS